MKIWREYLTWNHSHLLCASIYMFVLLTRTLKQHHIVKALPTKHDYFISNLEASYPRFLVPSSLLALRDWI